MGKARRDMLEYLRDNNVDIREENEILKAQIKMFK
jgi:hypothetical protein